MLSDRPGFALDVALAASGRSADATVDGFGPARVGLWFTPGWRDLGGKGSGRSTDNLAVLLRGTVSEEDDWGPLAEVGVGWSHEAQRLALALEVLGGLPVTAPEDVTLGGALTLDVQVDDHWWLMAATGASYPFDEEFSLFSSLNLSFQLDEERSLASLTPTELARGVREQGK